MFLKESGDYLKQISNNIPEKVSFIKEEFERGRLVTDEEGKIKVVEIGTGGGESLREFNNLFAKQDNVELIAVDALPELVASIKSNTGVEAIAADAGLLPMKDNSISAINASAILHEVSSYGVKSEESSEDKVYGTEAVSQALSEFNRVLLPGGVLSYRDVLAPTHDLNEKKTVKYSKKSWYQFANWFLHDFENRNFDFYKQDKLDLIPSGDGFELTASLVVQRELQRHYIMFRDYLRNARSKDFGVEIVRDEWMNKEDGIKSITFTLREDLAELINTDFLENHKSDTETIYRTNSDEFDKIYDIVIAHYFDQLEQGTELGVGFSEIINTWKEREGFEHYVYANIGNMLKMASANEDKDGYILFPESSESISTPPRFYYNRYLKDVIDDPEYDGKQLILFKKVLKEKAQASFADFKDSSSINALIEEQDIEDIDDNLRS